MAKLNKTLSIFFFLISLFSSLDLFASHAQGADISYECLGNGQYRIIYQFYRDCSGISISSSISATITSSCGGSVSQILTQDPNYPNGVEVSQLCGSVSSTCNGGALPGVQVYTFTAVVSLSPNCIYIVGYGEGSRNTSNNISSSQIYDLYVETTINTNNNICNSGPRFTSYPVPYYCIGQTYNYSHGTSEPDGDSLVFSLVAPLGATGTSLAYISPFTPVNPVPSNGGFIFDPQSGQMTFSPTTVGNYVVSVLVYEYRNGVLIGTTMRDIQIVVINCNNAPPVVQGNLNNTNTTGGEVIDNNSVGVCPGGTVTFTIIASDPTGQPISFSSNNATSIPGSSLSSTPINGRSDSVKITFTWTPGVLDSGFRYFTITVTDNVCPIPGNQILTYDITVLKGVNAGPDRAFCLEGGPVSVLVTGGSHFSWTTLGGGAPVGMVSATADSNIVSFAPLVTTTYVVKGNLIGGCKQLDTITINRVSGFSKFLSVTRPVICKFSSSEIDFLARPDSLGPYTFLWQPSVSNILATDSNTSATVRPYVTTKYSISATSKDGCVITDTTTIQVSGVAPRISISPDKNYVCPGDTVLLRTNISALACGLSPGGLALSCPSGSVFRSDTLGSSNTASLTVTPFRGGVQDARAQYLILSSELQGLGMTSGTIRDISFFVTAKASTLGYRGFSVSMGCTSLSQLSASGFVPGLDNVFTPKTITTTTGAWNKLIFDQPFDWDGFSNLIVEVCFDNTTSVGNDEVFVSNAFNGATIAAIGSATSGCNLTNPIAYNIRPNIIFGNCTPPLPSYNISWTPNSGLSCSNCINPKAVVDKNITYSLTVDDGTCTGDTLISLFVNPGVAITVTNDTTICSGGAMLNVAQTNPAPPACVKNYSLAAIPFAPILPTGSTTSFSLSDDQITSVQNIGFNFDFFCKTFSKFYIHANGFLTLVSGQTGSYTAPSVLPNSAAPNGIISLCWDDLYPPDGGTIDYFISGISPNRVLVVRYTAIAFLSGNGLVTTEAHLYEGTNVIEIHTQSLTDNTTHTQGIEDSSGTIGIPVPGRDAQAWTVSTPDAYRFTPQTSGVSITGISWSPGISLSDTSIFNPVAAPAQNTCYTAEVTYNNGCKVRDTVCVSLSTFSYSIDVNPDTVCPGSQAQLFMSGQGVDFAWTPASLLNDSTLPNPIATVSNTTKFGVVAKNAAGCLIKDSAVVFVYTPPLVSLGSDFDVCACDTSINLNPVITDFTGNTQYLWSNSTTNSDLSVSNSGIYALTITDGNDCTASSSQQVNIYCLKVKASSSADKNTINKGDSTQLFSNISGSNYTPSLTYNWIPTAYITDSILASPNASPLETTLYTVYVFDAINGCTALDSFSLTVNPPGLFAVPTGFSPNADGSNEYFYPYFPPGSSASVISMRIYNRWGQLVYSGAVAPGWDGKVGGLIAAIDTYTYYIQISSPDANQPNGAIVNNLVGSFALLR